MFGIISLFIIVIAVAGASINRGIREREAKNSEARERGYYRDPDHPNVVRSIDTDRIVRVKTDVNGFTKIIDSKSGMLVSDPTEGEWRAKMMSAQYEGDDRYTTYCTLKSEAPYEKKPGGFSFERNGNGAYGNPNDRLYFRTFWGMDFYMNVNGELERFTDDMECEFKKAGGKDSYKNEYLIGYKEAVEMMERYNAKVKNKPKNATESMKKEVSSMPVGRQGKGTETAKFVIERYPSFRYSAFPRTAMNYRGTGGRCICRERQYQSARFADHEHYEYKDPVVIQGIVDSTGHCLWGRLQTY